MLNEIFRNGVTAADSKLAEPEISRTLDNLSGLPGIIALGPLRTQKTTLGFTPDIGITIENPNGEEPFHIFAQIVPELRVQSLVAEIQDGIQSSETHPPDFLNERRWLVLAGNWKPDTQAKALRERVEEMATIKGIDDPMWEATIKRVKDAILECNAVSGVFDVIIPTEILGQIPDIEFDVGIGGALRTFSVKVVTSNGKIENIHHNLTEKNGPGSVNKLLPEHGLILLNGNHSSNTLTGKIKKEIQKSLLATSQSEASEEDI